MMTGFWRVVGCGGLSLLGMVNVALAQAESPKPKIGTEAADKPNVVFSGRADRAKAATISDERKRAVESALDWFTRHQNHDGSWSIDKHAAKEGQCTCRGEGETKSDAAATAFGLLPYFASGLTHKDESPHKTTIFRGLDWLLTHQAQDGNLAARSGQTMYTHGIATMAVCEAYGLSRDQRIGFCAQAAVNFIEAAQDPATGGWWYQPRQQGGDTSVFGWQLTALKTAQMAGLKVNPKTLEGAQRWLKSVAKGQKNGLYAYRPDSGPSPTMTAVGALGTEWLGANADDPRLTEGTQYLAALIPSARSRNCYYWHYGSMATHQAGGELGAKWDAALTKILLDQQVKEGCAKGSWSPTDPIPDPHGTAGGRVMVTSLAALALQPQRYVSLLAAADPAPVTPATTAVSLPLVEKQPLVSAVDRLVEALTFVGSPLSEAQLDALKAANKLPNDRDAVIAIQKTLDPLCVAVVNINPESRVKVAEGPAKKELTQQGWRTFLVKVENEAGVTAPLQAESPNLLPVYQRGQGARQKVTPQQKLVQPEDVPGRFLDVVMFNGQPLKKDLSGLAVEYRIIQLFSRDVGQREAKLGFNVGQGTQDIGFRNSVPMLFKCLPAVEVALGVKDTDGQPTTAAFVIRDKQGRIYPNPARRLAPDFFFHNQVYRADGESLHLPPGDYSVELSRGPEYRVETHNLTVKEGVVSQKAEFQLKRWIKPFDRRWYSGDHHVHAAGCAHYDSPTEGVSPADMMRHILGEDLNVGCVLSWGPCWYHQKQFFEGKTSALSRPNYLMRYDIEVSGFPSSHAGHLCLLRLKEDDYPNTNVIEDWPSWTLPVLKWGKEQGGVVGYSHSGWGIALPDYGPNGERMEISYPPKPGQATGRAADKLPDYAVPPFDGIGANEYIVTVAHNVCDFISAVDTPAIWELNIWYHTLNCGQRAVISGETDFPCIYGDKVGLGRIYAKLDPQQELNFDNWVLAVKDGRSYCGDGRSHLFDLKVNDLEVGTKGTAGSVSQLNLAQPGKVKVSFDAAALLEEQPTAETEAIRTRRLDQKPYWHIERCRVGQTRKVPVEVIVNGYPVARQEIVADGKTNSMSFDIDVPHSSWIAVRILPSAHTNPVYVEVGGKPIRASKRSAEWCIKSVDQCWSKKAGAIREPERATAKAAYDFAKAAYEKALRESVAD